MTHPALSLSPARRRAFTLIELIVVVIIIAVLAAIGAVAYNQYASKARANSALGSAASLRTAVMAASARDDLAPAAEVDSLWTTADGDSTAFLRALSADYTGTVAYTATAADGSAPATLQVGGTGSGNHAACLGLPDTVSAPVTLTAGTCGGTDGAGGAAQDPKGANTVPNTLVAGYGHTCAIVDAAAYCWGRNYEGELGNGSTAGSSSTPVQVTGLAGMTVTALAAGYEHTCALVDAAVYCWGLNAEGQLGDGTITNRSAPVQVTGLAGMTVTALAAGTYHTCALADAGVYCWGSDNSGELGDGAPTTRRPTPVPVTGLSGRTVTALAGGNGHTCAIADGSAYCWGANNTGQLGDGTTVVRTAPTPVVGLTGMTVTALAANNVSTCAVAGGGAYCWGGNEFGGLGDGTTTARSVPTAVVGMPGAAVTGVAVGGYHACAVAAGGAYCWGDNNDGRLGDGTTVHRHTAVAVSGLAGMTVTALAAGSSHTCALAGSAVYCWGYNGNGQLGDGTGTSRSTPVPVLIGG